MIQYCHTLYHRLCRLPRTLLAGLQVYGAGELHLQTVPRYLKKAVLMVISRVDEFEAPKVQFSLSFRHRNIAFLVSMAATL
jgi:hypothetical protein